METKQNDGGQAFPMVDVLIDGQAIGSAGMSIRQYAAIHLRVPDSGSDWLDDMIRNSKKESPMVVLFQGDLRDYFAGQALIGIMAHDPTENAYLMASDCYMIADAMIETRSK